MLFINLDEKSKGPLKKEIKSFSQINKLIHLSKGKEFLLILLEKEKTFFQGIHYSFNIFLEKSPDGTLNTFGKNDRFYFSFILPFSDILRKNKQEEVSCIFVIKEGEENNQNFSLSFGKYTIYQIY